MRSASANPRVIAEQRAIALALEQRIRGNRGAHLHGFDRVARQRRRRPRAQGIANALQGRVFVALRVLGQQLVRDQGAVRPAGHDVREGAAAIDPELPAGLRDSRDTCQQMAMEM